MFSPTASEGGFELYGKLLRKFGRNARRSKGDALYPYAKQVGVSEKQSLIRSSLLQRKLCAWLPVQDFCG